MEYYSHQYPSFRHLPIDEPIDLLNVAFENPRTLKAKQQPLKGRNNRNQTRHSTTIVTEAVRTMDSGISLPEVNTYDVPDRLTGREQLAELRRICPDRTWNFVS
jgi:hypothetical protein